MGIDNIILDSDTNIVPGGMDTGNDRTSHECYMLGWGRTCPGCEYARILVEAPTVVLSAADCESYWGASVDPAYHVCAYNGWISTCDGDYGGPLICRADSGDAWTLVGIGSWGNAGCNPAFPAVYTRVSSYTDWVCTSTNGDVCVSR